jgi:two-component sensor histidine kinase
VRLDIPHRRTLTANLTIGVSIALLVYYLKETSALEYLLAYLAQLQARMYLALARNRFAYASSPAGLCCDALCVVAAAWLWTYLKAGAGRIAWTLALALALVPVAMVVYRVSGVILVSPLIVLGIAVAMALESSGDIASRRLHARIVGEKQDAEFSILGHLNHSVKPNLQIAKSPLIAVKEYLEQRGVSGEVLARRLDGSDETVGEALEKAVSSLERIGGILEETRKLVTRQFAPEDFREVALGPLLEREVAPIHGDRVRIEVSGDRTAALWLHRESFVEAINNLVRNALTHGARPGEGAPLLRFKLRETRSRVIIDYTNNGAPFPANLSAKDFLTYGRKSQDSPGEGLGGAWIGKVVEAHRGSFEIVRDGEPLHFRLSFPKRGA